jgi:hypothetical protein
MGALLYKKRLLIKITQLHNSIVTDFIPKISSNFIMMLNGVGNSFLVTSLMLHGRIPFLEIRRPETSYY